jgi:hypothetical protein
VKQRVSSVGDARGFRWRLGILQGRREHALAQAAERLARAEHERSASEQRLQCARAEQDDQLGAIGGARMLDPALRLQALTYLAQAAAQIESASRALAGAERTRDDALLDAQRAQRELDVLARLREKALAGFLADEARRQARESDLAWLSRHGAMEGSR